MLTSNSSSRAPQDLVIRAEPLGDKKRATTSCCDDNLVPGHGRPRETTLGDAIAAAQLRLQKLAPGGCKRTLMTSPPTDGQGITYKMKVTNPTAAATTMPATTTTATTGTTTTTTGTTTTTTITTTPMTFPGAMIPKREREAYEVIEYNKTMRDQPSNANLVPIPGHGATACDVPATTAPADAPATTEHDPWASWGSKGLGCNNTTTTSPTPTSRQHSNATNHINPDLRSGAASDSPLTRRVSKPQHVPPLQDSDDEVNVRESPTYDATAHNDDESDTDDMTTEQIKDVMAMANGYNNIERDATDEESTPNDPDFDADTGMAELMRIMHNYKADRDSSSRRLSDALRRPTESHGETMHAACLDEDQSDDEVVAAASAEPTFRERVVQIAIDSGAGKNVAPPEMVEGYRVSPSHGSRNGKHFIAANGGRILNLGESMLNLVDEKGGKLRSNFQIADVSRMLYSVSQICDAGCEVKFNKSEGLVLKDGRTLARFPRQGGLYVLTTTLQSPEAHLAKPADTGFAGPGK